MKERREERKRENMEGRKNEWERKERKYEREKLIKMNHEQHSKKERNIK